MKKNTLIGFLILGLVIMAVGHFYKNDVINNLKEKENPSMAIIYNDSIIHFFHGAVKLSKIGQWQTKKVSTDPLVLFRDTCNEPTVLYTDTCYGEYSGGYFDGYEHARKLFSNMDTVYLLDSLLMYGRIKIPRTAALWISHCTFKSMYNRMDAVPDSTNYELILEQYRFYD